MSTWIAIAATLIPLAGCAGLPRVAYRLPGTSLVPHAAAGIEDRSAEYGRLFCGVLRHVGAEGGPWGDCGEYIETPGAAEAPLPEPATRFRILVIPGIFGQCFSPELQAFSDALAHLRAAHSLTAEYLDVPALGSCDHNAGVIASHLRLRLEEDPRKYIVVGYSKGACDVMTALVARPEVRDAVAAVITVGGAAGGSRLPDLVPDFLVQLLGKMRLGRCEKADAGGVESLRRPVRQAFLREHPAPVVPTYALVAVSAEKTTSRALRPFWRKLARISLDQDSQVIASEGVWPGARFLGVLKGDHWAVAMPFELLKDSAFSKIVDHNHFPRTVLLEAAIRLVLADLEPPPAPTPVSGERPSRRRAGRH